jgi:aryl-alcohol dehydrogenase-like predicted oxidoreductase
LTDELFTKVEALEDFARRRDVSLLSVAIGAIASKEGVASVPIGATRPAQVLENVRASEWIPSPDDRAELSKLI